MEDLTKTVKRKISEKKFVIVPELLLSYTYFLNDQHSCYICIGFDIETFKLKIILFKNTIFLMLCYQDWKNITNNIELIKKHFELGNYALENPVYGELPKAVGFCTIKLSQRNNEKCLTVVSGDGLKKIIIITQSEWEHLYELYPFLNSVISWYNKVESEVESYYNIYVSKCFEKKKIQLAYEDFFIPNQAEGYNYYNYSRLFSEIPILCKSKLSNDYYTFNYMFDKI